MRRIFVNLHENLLIPFVFVTSIYLLMLYLFFNIPFAVLSKFVMMNILGIFLPGFAFAALLEVKLSRFTMLMYAYILGYTLTVVEYFVSEIFDRKVFFNHSVVGCNLKFSYHHREKEKRISIFSKSK